MDEANDLLDDTVKADIQGYDIDGEIVKAARANAQNRQVWSILIHFQQRPGKRSQPSEEIWFYYHQPALRRASGGEEEPSCSLYRKWEMRFRRLDSWSEYVITAYEDAEKYIGRKADKNRKIYNGMMKTYFYQFLGPRPPKRKQEENS